MCLGRGDVIGPRTLALDAMEIDARAVPALISVTAFVQ